MAKGKKTGKTGKSKSKPADNSADEKGSAKVSAFTLPDHATSEDKKHADSAASGVNREC